jgi:hypothetical protein
MRPFDKLKVTEKTRRDCFVAPKTPLLATTDSRIISMAEMVNKTGRPIAQAAFGWMTLAL